MGEKTQKDSWRTPPAREAEVKIFSLSDLQDFCK